MQANAGRCTDWFAFYRLRSNRLSEILYKPESLVFPRDAKIDVYTSSSQNMISKSINLTASWLTFVTLARKRRKRLYDVKNF